MLITKQKPTSTSSTHPRRLRKNGANIYLQSTHAAAPIVLLARTTDEQMLSKEGFVSAAIPGKSSQGILDPRSFLATMCSYNQPLSYEQFKDDPNIAPEKSDHDNVNER